MKEKDLNDQILRENCSEDEMRGWMRNPFVIGDRVYATDAYVLLSINKDATNVSSDQIENPERILKFIPKENCNHSFGIKKMSQAIYNIKKEKLWNTKRCDECCGEGEVEWEYKTHTKEFECPRCDGNGEIRSGGYDMVIPIGTYVDIYGVRFGVRFITRLISIAERKGINTISAIYILDKVNPIVFRVGDFDVLIMPSVPLTSDSVIFSINK